MKPTSIAVMSVACPVMKEVYEIFANVREYCSFNRKVQKLTSQLKSAQVKNKQHPIHQSAALLADDLKSRVTKHIKNANKPFVNRFTVTLVILPTLLVGLASSGFSAAGMATGSLLSNCAIHLSSKLRERGIAYFEEKMISELNSAMTIRTVPKKPKTRFKIFPLPFVNKLLL